MNDHTPFQYVESEFMKRDEYASLIDDPEGFLLRTWYPRVYDNLKGLEHLPSLFSGVESTSMPFMLIPFAAGPLREALDTLLAAADSCLAEMGPAFLAGAEIQRRWGAPNLAGSFGLAPFDIIGDTLRGTKGVMLDMRRQPDALIEACDAITPAAIRMATEGCMASGRPFVQIPLHKGDDTFMSEEQFARFYWPSFKRLLEGIIDAGMVPMPFVEGNYNKKLDVIAGSDLPKGKIGWMFDRTDIRVAKKKLGGKACIGGNVPSSLIATGTGEQVDDYCRQLIEDVAPGGGFFLSPGAVIDHANPETIRAFLASTKKYGRYAG
ncbi:MAG: uroporphyrinogen decarboxylase family protein [Desulfuromonadaceae bacterium]|nr:uroporphyrinogen decarboxylase family protein [Desulfuromonadaceae bacterium]